MSLCCEMKYKRLAVSFERSKGSIDRVFIAEISPMNRDIVAVMSNVVQFAAGCRSNEHVDICVTLNESVHKV